MPGPSPHPVRETLDDLLGSQLDERALAEFCRRARVPQASLSSLRRGLQQRPKAWIVQNIASALNVPAQRVRAAIDGARAERGR
jgi:hypothetical protein